MGAGAGIEGLFSSYKQSKTPALISSGVILSSLGVATLVKKSKKNRKIKEYMNIIELIESSRNYLEENDPISEEVLANLVYRLDLRKKIKVEFELMDLADAIVRIDQAELLCRGIRLVGLDEMIKDYIRPSLER